MPSRMMFGVGWKADAGCGEPAVLRKPHDNMKQAARRAPLFSLS